MGQDDQTYENGLKPYGLVYQLIINHEIPVSWAINSSKVKDGDDFTADGKTYKGGSFIIPANHASQLVVAEIEIWKAKGVVVDGPLAAEFTAPIYKNLTSWPRAVLDTENGKIVTEYYETAEVDVNSYLEASDPTALTNCGDIYVLPHADPQDWVDDKATWGPALEAFVLNDGYLWTGCHAVSSMESVVGLNFLSKEGLVLGDAFGVQNPVIHDDGTPPYSYDPSTASDPIMQFLGIMDGAMQQGSEQIYLPLEAGWREGTTVSVYDPDHPQITGGTDVLSPGRAALVAYGRAYDTAGIVMFEAGHRFTRGEVAEQVAAQRAYFNFVLMSGALKQLDLTTLTSSTFLQASHTYSFEAQVDGGVGPFTYEWTSSCAGGEFSNPDSSHTTYITPDNIANCEVFNINMILIKLKVTDACGRANFEHTVLNFDTVITTDTIPNPGDPRIYFTDVEGGEIDELSDNATSWFVVNYEDTSATGPITVILTTTEGDTMTVVLEETNIAGLFNETVQFKYVESVSVNNDVIEGLQNPADVFAIQQVTATRDTVSASIDYQAYVTGITYTDLDGNIITDISEYTGTEFIIIVEDNKFTGDSIPITITTTDGDLLNTHVTLTSTRGQFRDTVTFEFVNEINTSNTIVEGLNVTPATTITTTFTDLNGKEVEGDLIVQSILTLVDTTTIYFTDTTGLPILQLEDTPVSWFKVWVKDSTASGTVTVTLTTSEGDVETVTLEEVSPGEFSATVQFQYVATPVEDNNILEGSTSPADVFLTNTATAVRGTDSATVNYHAYVTDMYFTDMEGNIITNISEFTGTQFIIIVEDNKFSGDSIQVQLTTSDGDLLTTYVTSTSTRGQFRDTVTFEFTNQVDTENQVIEGLETSLSTIVEAVFTDLNSDTVKAEFTLIPGNTLEVANAWIVDSDGDGTADRVFVQFVGELPSLPGEVTDIQWPGADGETRNATSDQISFGADNSIVVIDLSDNPFEQGVTSASTDPDNLPTLTLPDDEIFGNQKPVIADSIGPVIITAIKNPSTRYLLQTSDGELIPKDSTPTLTITFSEAVIPTDLAGTVPWDSILMYVTADGDTLPLEISGTPTISEDGLTWILPLKEELGQVNLISGDRVFVRPDAPYTDQNGNTISTREKEVEGTDDDNTRVDVMLIQPIIGEQNFNTQVNVNVTNPEGIPIVDEDGNLIRYTNNVDLFQTSQWIPPAQMNEFGEIDLNQACAAEPSEMVGFPKDCLSAILVLTDSSYTANVFIYDHLGKFIYSSKQTFGDCGELDNLARRQSTGQFASYIIWNQKSIDGQYVGSGVYPIRIELQVKGENFKVIYTKQGIARSEVPSKTCAQ